MRRGVTLLELLVVLVLMAIASAVVLPAFHTSNADALAGILNDSESGVAASGLIATPEVDDVLTKARRIAIKRGEPVRVRITGDGVWAIVSANGGEPIENGRVPKAVSWTPDLTVDAIGNCLLQPATVPIQQAIAWDALACRWRRGPSLAATVSRGAS